MLASGKRAPPGDCQQYRSPPYPQNCPHSFPHAQSRIPREEEDEFTTSGKWSAGARGGLCEEEEQQQEEEKEKLVTSGNWRGK